MQTTATKRLDFGSDTLLGRIEQDQDQYDNPSIELHKIGDEIYQCYDGAIYQLSKSSAEQAAADIDGWLREVAVCLADSAGDNPDPGVSYTAARNLELLRWGILSSEDLEPEADDVPVYIIRTSHYYGYNPTDWVTDESLARGWDKPIVFANRQAAQDWIDEANEGTYYLSHNEACRPTYHIVRTD